MSKQINRKAAAGPDVVAVSMVAMVACAFAGNASANPTAAHPDAELSARIAVIAERIRLRAPELARELPAQQKVAWGNR